jgi:hypothetical protein
MKQHKSRMRRAAFESLESRTLFAATLDLGTLVPSAHAASGSVSVTAFVDAFGTLNTNPVGSKAIFSVAQAHTPVVLHLSAKDADPDATADVRVRVASSSQDPNLDDPLIDKVVKPGVGAQAFSLVLDRDSYTIALDPVHYVGGFDQFNSPLPAEEDFTIDGSAVVTTPAITIKDRGANITPGSVTPSASNGTDFGTVNVGAADQQTYTITNTGGGTLNLSLSSLPAGFKAVSPALHPLGQGTSENLVVQLDTHAAGTFGGRVTIGTNVTGLPAFTFAVRGTVATPVGSISGGVFDDYNRNRLKDAGDIPLAGRRVYVDLKNLGKYLAGDPTALTDANGNYTIGNLKPGNYVLREVPAAGFTATAPIGALYKVPVTANHISSGYAFAEAPPASTPYGPAFVVKYGAVLQAENFDNGGEGVAYHDTDAANVGGQYRQSGVDVEKIPTGGFFVGFIRGSEWLNYTVNVAATGVYTLGFRFRPLSSATKGPTFHLEVDGQNVTGPLAAKPGAFVFSTISKAVKLSAGKHVLRVFFDTPAPGQLYFGNFDSITFSK